MQTHAGPVLAMLVSVSPCEPLVDYVGHILMVSSVPSDSYSFSSPSSVELHSSEGIVKKTLQAFIAKLQMESTEEVIYIGDHESKKQV